MLKKLALWFICFGLSFLVESLGWAEQGRAFFYIGVGIMGLMFISFDFIDPDAFDVTERIGYRIALVLSYAVYVVIALFATWVVTKLFDVDFFVACQITSFGQCLCFSSKKDDD